MAQQAQELLETTRAKLFAASGDPRDEYKSTPLGLLCLLADRARTSPEKLKRQLKELNKDKNLTEDERIKSTTIDYWFSGEAKLIQETQREKLAKALPRVLPNIKGRPIEVGWLDTKLISEDELREKIIEQETNISARSGGRRKGQKPATYSGRGGRARRNN